MIHDYGTIIVQNLPFAQRKLGIANRVTQVIDNPSNSEDKVIAFTDAGATITEVRAVMQGTGTITYNVIFGPDRLGAGTNVTDTPVPLSNTTDGVNAVLDNPVVPPDSWVRLVTTAKVGNVTELAVSIEYSPR